LKRATISRSRLSPLAVQFAGKAWSMLMALAFLPMYIDILGNQKFAIIGFYLVCQAVVSLLDTAITATVNKEIAEARLHSSDKLASSIRTLELLIYSIAGFILVIGCLFSSFLAEKLQARTGVELSECWNNSLLIICAICMQGIFLFYLSSILALQRHFLYSGIRSLWFTGRFAGGVICLILIAPSPSIFLACHCITTFLLIGLLRYLLWQTVPRPFRAFTFDTKVVTRNFSFIGSAISITASTVLLCQVDKLILFNIVDPADYTFYIAVWTLTGGLRQLVEPLFIFLLPNFTASSVAHATENIKKLFAFSMQVTILVVVPLGITAMFFPVEILTYWLKGFTIQWKHQVTYELLLIGMCMNAMALVPYGLQLSRNDTSQLLKTNILLVTICLPALVFLHFDNGILLASSMWVFSNAVYTFFTTPQTYWQAFKERYFLWFLRNMVFPTAACFFAIGFSKKIVGLYFVAESFPSLILLLLVIWFSGFISVLFCYPELLRRALNKSSFRTLSSDRT
jgi:O-antigen/teichoic acid export membrane protein